MSRMVHFQICRVGGYIHGYGRTLYFVFFFFYFNYIVQHSLIWASEPIEGDNIHSLTAVIWPQRQPL